MRRKFLHLSRAVRASILLLGFVVPFSSFASCTGGNGNQQSSLAGKDATVGDAPADAKETSADVNVIEEVAPPLDGPVSRTFCELPGSLVFGSGGSKTLISGGETAAPSLSWLSLPAGYCAHYFAHVPTSRQIRFAPGGELFVASPSTPTAGGAPAGLGAIVVLFDDNHDGYADGDTLPHSDGSAQKLALFLSDSSVASTQGLLFAPGFFYYQSSTSILKLPYVTGERSATGSPQTIADITMFESSDHWPKTLDIADDGTIYVGNGGDQSEVCEADTTLPRPFHGGVLKIGGADDPVGGTPVARGFRNPIAIRCQRGHDLCFSAELGLDGSQSTGGREKVVPIRQGDDWGYPCCATTNVPYAGTPSPNCSQVASETVAFVIGDTPFGLDFEPGSWPAPFSKNLFVATHGEVGSWEGARVVAVPTESDGLPVQSSDLESSTGLTDFATGWPESSAVQPQGRPSALTFAPDGRLFLANDQDGDIFWMAPVGVGADP
jgi:glucose/arabinose dehydrogenase